MPDDVVRNEQRAWSDAEVVRYYQTHRNQPGDLYDSERVFLPTILEEVGSVLDVGCAAGGFSRIMRDFNPNLHYVGVDIAPSMIERARRDYPECEFYVSDGLDLARIPGEFDLVHCSGVLHLNSRYEQIVRAMWSRTRRFMLCDFRLTKGATVTGEMDLDSCGRAAPSGRLPYFVLNVDELTGILESLDPPPVEIRSHSYPHPVSPSARVSVDNVIMAFYLLDKSGNSRP